MRGSEIAGGVALAGLFAILALSWTSDDDPSVRTEPSESAGATSASTAASPSSSAVAAASTSSTTIAPTASGTASTTSTITDETAPASSAPPATTSAPAATEPAPGSSVPPATTLPFEQRAAIRVRALNGGAGRGAGGRATDALEEAGFDPLSPADAWQHIDIPGHVLFREGADLAAVTMAEVLGYPLEHVVPGHDEDDNWRHFSDGVDVLVVVGPADVVH